MPDDSNKVETNSSINAAPDKAPDALVASGEAAAPQLKTGAETTPAKPDRKAKKDNKNSPKLEDLSTLPQLHPVTEEEKKKKSADKDFPEIEMMLEIREKINQFNSKVYGAVFNIAKFPVAKAADAIKETDTYNAMKEKLDPVMDVVNSITAPISKAYAAIKQVAAGDYDFDDKKTASQKKTNSSDNRITDTSKTGIIEQREGYDQEVKEDRLGIDVDGDDVENAAQEEAAPEMNALGDTVTNPQDAANNADFTTSYQDYDDVANTSRDRPGVDANGQAVEADNTTTMNPN